MMKREWTCKYIDRRRAVCSRDLHIVAGKAEKRFRSLPCDVGSGKKLRCLIKTLSEFICNPTMFDDCSYWEVGWDQNSNLVQNMSSVWPNNFGFFPSCSRIKWKLHYVEPFAVCLLPLSLFWLKTMRWARHRIWHCYYFSDIPAASRLSDSVVSFAAL